MDEKKILDEVLTYLVLEEKKDLLELVLTKIKKDIKSWKENENNKKGEE